MDNKKIAIVYDWIDKWGGVERVLIVLHEMFPKAVFYTSYFDKKNASWAKNLNIKTSFIQKLPDFIKKSRIFSLLFYPIAFESFNFNDYDIVISVSSSFAKSIITKPNIKHFLYLLTPTRFLWSHHNDYFKNNFITDFIFQYLKKWDLVSSQRPDSVISISNKVKERAKRYYKINSKVLYPPFDFEHWENVKIKPSTFNNFYLVVGRLENYKKIELVLKTFNRRKDYLIIVGKGSLKNSLEKIANKNIVFYSDLKDEELAGLYSKAKGLIMPQNEDFGYVSLEAQFFGCPVLTFKESGASETIIEGKTGFYFYKQTVKDLLSNLERFDKIAYNLRSNLIVGKGKSLLFFDKKRFIKEFIKIINL